MADFPEIEDLIEELTTTGKEELDRDHLKKLLNLCRKSHPNLEFSYTKLYEQLQEEHSEIRFSAFQIMDKLFLRSHRFRELLLQDAPDILVVAMGTDQHDRPLPPPLKVAKQLQKMALEKLNTWYERFGKGYRLLELAFEFVRDVKKVKFDEMQVRTAAEVRNTQQAKLKEVRLTASKLEQVDIQYEDRKESFLSDIKQMKSCFEMLVQKLSNQHTDTGDSGTIHDPGFLEGNESGITSYNFTLSLSISQKHVIYETPDNEDAIRRLRELYKENRGHENEAKRWLNVLLKCGSTDKWKIEEILRLKNTLSGLCSQFLDLEIREDGYFSSDDDGGEMFVEVPEKMMKTDVHSDVDGEERPTCSRYLEPDAGENMKREYKSEASHHSSIREKHLAIAPVVPFDSDLKLWETESGNIDISSYKSDSLHRFWKTNEHQENFVPSEVEASMRERAFRMETKFEPVERKCGAQLPQGGVCQRMDRYKCPFHGKIVERDSVGRALHPEDIERDKQLDVQRKEKECLQIQKDIEATTGVSLIKKKRPRVSKAQTRKDIQKKRYARLTNIKKTGDNEVTSKKGLKNKVFSARSLDKISHAKNQSSQRKHQERFGSNFNY